MSVQLYPLLMVIAVLVVFAAVIAVAYVVMNVRAERKLERRIQGGDVESDDGFSDPRGSAVLQAAARQGREIERFVDKSGGETRQLLAQAGWRHGEARLMFYALQGLAPVILALLVFGAFLAGLKVLHSPAHLVVGLAFAVIIGLLLPRLVLRRAATQRRERIRAEVPLLVNLLVMLYEAGLSTRQALASLVRDGGRVLPELGDDFEALVRQMEAGADSNEVLHAYGRSMDVDDLSGILGILRQIDRYGGEIRAPLLEALQVIEERRGLDMRERVNIISGRMTVVMVLFFFPSLLIFLAAPPLMSIVHTLGSLSK